MNLDDAVAKLRELACPRCLRLGGLAINGVQPGAGDCEWVGLCSSYGYRFDLECAATALERLKAEARV